MGLRMRRGRGVTRDIDADYDEHAAVVTGREREAAGVKAVLVSLQRSISSMGPWRTAASLIRLNQRHGFDCPGCAWPEEPGGRKFAEFCENGAKAVAEEGTKRVVTPEFFARHSISDLEGRPEYWLSQQGRLTHPVVLRPGDDHYREISWPDAHALIAGELKALADPNEAVFYTSGRTSNEAAFLYQLLVRSFGTNNLPDCSNMCHESSGAALVDAIGIGKGSVSVEDVAGADLIIIAGQNPGTNHPRMLSVLEKAKANGAKIIAVNPLPEAGLIRFKDPQKVHGVVGHGVPIADEFVQIRLGGDMALFAGIARLLLEADDRRPGSVGLSIGCAAMEQVAFFAGAIGALAGAVAVIALRNPFYSVLALVVHLFSLAGLFLILHAEFVAAAQVVVYAGAVMVLYVFVVAYVGGSDEPLGPEGGSLRKIGPLFADDPRAEFVTADLLNWAPPAPATSPSPAMHRPSSQR